MNALHLIDFRLPVEFGGRKFSVGRIRLSTVLRVLVRFDERLREFVAQESPDGVALFNSLDREDTSALFAFLLDPYDPDFVREHLDLAATSQISVAFGYVNDLARIWGALKLSAPPPPSPPEPSPGGVKPGPPLDPLVVAIDRIAQRYGIDPTTIPSWHFEVFLDFSEVLDADKDALDEAIRNGIFLRDGSHLDPDLLDDSAIVPGPIPDFNRVN